jgi:hypothetical protein
LRLNLWLDQPSRSARKLPDFLHPLAGANEVDLCHQPLIGDRLSDDLGRLDFRIHRPLQRDSPRDCQPIAI